MSYWIFLDDVRKPTDVTWLPLPQGPWIVTRNYEEFVRKVREKGVPKLVSFDHDLAPEHYRDSMHAEDKHYNRYYTDGTFKVKTGYDAAVWFANFCSMKEAKLPTCFVHTLNPIGRENIIKALRREPIPLP